MTTCILFQKRIKKEQIKNILQTYYETPDVAFHRVEIENESEEVVTGRPDYNSYYYPRLTFHYVIEDKVENIIYSIYEMDEVGNKIVMPDRAIMAYHTKVYYLDIVPIQHSAELCTPMYLRYMEAITNVYNSYSSWTGGDSLTHDLSEEGIPTTHHNLILKLESGKKLKVTRNRSCDYHQGAVFNTYIFSEREAGEEDIQIVSDMSVKYLPKSMEINTSHRDGTAGSHLLLYRNPEIKKIIDDFFN